MQETLPITATVKEGRQHPFIALEPTNTIPVSFAPGLLTLNLRDGTTLAEAQGLAAHIRKLVTAVTHVPRKHET
jgi:hypothetical protein